MTFSATRLDRLPAAERGLTIGDFLVPIAVAERISSRVRHVALVIVGALFIALTAGLTLDLRGETITLLGDVRVTLPISPVPITAQTFAVLLVGGALGFRRGVLAVLLYLVLGLFLPVYADHASGLDTFVTRADGYWLLGATGGYLLGFALAAGLVGRLAELGWDRHVGGAVVAMALGNLVVYAIGVPWLMAATGYDLGTALNKGVAPFLAADLLKLALAGILFPVAWWVVGRRQDER
ncbi:MAG: biotin biosynthesis protein BioY [Chloroflexi bacterium]|nr:biotin biosynthesis protein BioY [Chloroflexota bacterium]